MGARWARFWVLEVPGMSGDGSNPFVCPSRGLKPYRMGVGDFFVPLGALKEAGGAGKGGGG